MNGEKPMELPLQSKPSRNRSDTATHYRHLTQWTTLIVLVVSLTPMLLVGAVIYSQFHQSYKEKVHAHLAELVLKHKQNIDAFLRERLNNIRFLASSSDCKEIWKELVLARQLGILQEEYGTVFEDLGVVNSQGVQVAYAGPFKLDKAYYGEADWFQQAIRNDVFISDVFLGLRGYPHFIITVRHYLGEEMMILRSTINFSAFNSLVQNIRLGRTGFAFILNRSGQLQTDVAFDDVLPADPEYARHFIKLAERAKKDVYVTEEQDENGQWNIFVSSFLKDGDWLMVYRQNRADAYEDIYRAQRITILILLLGGLGIVSTAFLVSKSLVLRMAEVDREKELMNRQVVETGKLASVGQLAAGIAHEINNPVAIMVEEAGWIEDLLEEEDLRASENLDEFLRALRQIHTQGRRCKEITHKLLSFARKTDSRVEDVPINELIQELVDLSSQRTRYSNVTINTDLQSSLPALRISVTEVQQVLLNLINNALDAMEKTGGTLNIITRLENGRIIVEVADNGPGIPSSNLDRIFEPFFTTKPVGKGTGLGLSICYGIVKKMGGDIEVESTVDVGTRFRVWIPLEKKEE